jgi:hypothetical protein
MRTTEIFSLPLLFTTDYTADYKIAEIKTLDKLKKSCTIYF